MGCGPSHAIVEADVNLSGRNSDGHAGSPGMVSDHTCGHLEGSESPDLHLSCHYEQSRPI